MKLKIETSGLILLLLTSCNPFELKPLDVKTVKNQKITARWFYTSDITTVHNHVEVKTNKGWVQVMEADGTYKIQDVLINNDTVIIQVYKEMGIYELTSKYWGTHVVLDTSISLYQYMKKFNPEQAKYFKE